MSKTSDDRQLRRQKPLSIILERSREDPTSDFNSTKESLKYFDQQPNQAKGNSAQLPSKRFKEMDISDSEFCSSTNALSLIAKDEAERLQFVNSKVDSFLERSDVENDGSKLNTAVLEDTIGTYFYRRSSNPMKEGRNFLKKSFENSDWFENSWFRNSQPSDTSTPNHKSHSAHSAVHDDPFSASAILYDYQDGPIHQNRKSSTQGSALLEMDMNKSSSKSILQILNESNGSISSMVKFFSGPETVGMGKEELLAHVLKYCQARENAENSTNATTTEDLDTSSFSGFKGSLQRDSESSATSKSANSSRENSTDTIKANSPGDKVSTKKRVASTTSASTSPIQDEVFISPPPCNNLPKPKLRPILKASSLKDFRENMYWDDIQSQIQSLAQTKSSNFLPSNSVPNPQIWSKPQNFICATAATTTAPTPAHQFPFPMTHGNPLPDKNSLPYVLNFPQTLDCVEANSKSASSMQPQQQPFPPYGFPPFIIQIQCSCQKEHQTCDCKRKSTASTGFGSVDNFNPNKTLVPKRSKDLAEKPEESTCTSLLYSSQFSPDIPNIKVDKAVVGFVNTKVGQIKIATVNIHNPTNMGILLKGGVRKTPDQNFWNYSDSDSSIQPRDLSFSIPKEKMLTLTLAFRPSRPGQIFGHYIIKFKRGDGPAGDCDTVYKTEIQLVGCGIPLKPTKAKSNGAPCW